MYVPDHPKTIKVSYQKYELVFVPEGHEALGGDNLGSFDSTLGKIYIREGLHHRVRGETIIHEALHAIFHHWCLEHPARLKEETTVNTLGMGLATIFADNPDLIKYLSELLKSN